MTADHKRRLHVGRGCALAAAIGLVLIGGCGLAAHLYDRHWEKKVEAKLAEYRAAGQPVTWEEVVAARQSVPPEENSALIFLEAFKQMAPFDNMCTEVFARDFAIKWTGGARHSKEVRDLINARLAANQGALNIIDGAAELPSGAYPIDPAEAPSSVALRHVSPLRWTAKLCALRAAHRAESGDRPEAVEALMVSRKVGLSLAEHPLLIEELVRIAFESLWLGAMQRSLETCGLASTDVLALRRDVASAYVKRTMAAAFSAETVKILCYTEAPETGVAELLDLGVNPPYVYLYVLVPGLRQKDALLACRLTDRLSEACALSARGQWLAANSIGGDCSSLRLGGSLTAVGMSAWCPALASDVQARTRLRVADAALAVEQWRLAHGRWPDSLEQLVPELLEEVPDDPFCNEKIRYRRTEDGVVVYSVGPDGQDNNGEPEEDHWDEAYDIPFRLLDPELRGGRTLTFREEVMDSELPLEALEEAGYTVEKLQALGFSEADIRELGWR